jgi:parvulin-like peptidyl-prolyl isomerase
MRAAVARTVRSFLALGALLLCGGTLVACGDSVPSGAVAKVADVTISKASFSHWLVVAQKSQIAATAPGSLAPPLDSPNFTACVAFHQQNDPKPPKGTPNPTPASLKAACAQAYTGALQQAVPFLITADWLQGEAADQNITLTTAEVAKMLKTIESQMFKTPAALQAFLSESGETNDDLLYRVRIETLRTKLQTKITSGKVTVTPAQIAAYYKQNAAKPPLSTPATRDLRVVLVKSAGLATHVRALIQGGQSIGAVARKFSIDPATKARGGALIGVKKGDEEAALDTAIFGAHVGQLVGPVKTSFGYEVFRLQKITPGKTQSLAQATAAIRQTLTQNAQQAQLTAYGKHFQDKWMSRTTCAKGYVVAECKNAPKAKTTTTGAATQSTTPSP